MVLVSRLATRFRLCQVVMVALVVGMAASAAAQTTEAVIFGSVTDEQGLALPGVAVTVRNQDTGTTRTLVTGGAGEYRAAALTPGNYEVLVELAGFASVQVTDIALVSQQVARQDVEMGLSTLQETVTVTGEAPQVEVTQTQVSAIITEEQLEMLPVANRAMISYALLLPGTSTDGSRPRRNNAQVGAGTLRFTTLSLVDGMHNMSTKAGEPRQDMPQPAVREVRVIQTMPNAEFGGRAGGVVSIVTRGGTNVFSGEAYEYFRNKNLVRLDPLTQATLDASGEEKPEFSRHQFGGGFGGPLVQDRVHFFGAIEDTEQKQTYRVDSGRPELYGSLEGIFPNDHTNRLFFARVDSQLSPNQNAFVRWAWQGGTFECEGCGGNVSSGETLYIQRDATVGGHTWVMGSRFLNEFRFQWGQQWHHSKPLGTPDFFEQVMTPERAQFTEQQFIFPSFSHEPESDYYNHNAPVEPEIRNDFSMLFSGHSVKIGYAFQNLFLQEDQQGNSSGAWEFDTDQAFDPDNPATLAALSNPILFEAELPFWVERQKHHFHQFYLQDEWRPLSNLTLNLGVRYEVDTGVWNRNRDNNTYYPTPLPYVDFASRGDFNNFSPRFGLVWDPADDGMTVVRMGAGRQFNVIQNGIPGAETSFGQQFDIEIDNPSYPDPYGGLDPLTFASAGTPNIGIVSNDLVNPWSDMFTAGVSRELGASLALHVDGVYTDSKGFDVGHRINARDPVTRLRPLTDWGNITEDRSVGWQKYRAMYVRLQKRFSNRHQYQVSYTLAKSTDNSFGTNNTGNRTDLNNPDLDEGYSLNDRRHGLVFSGAMDVGAGVTFGGVWTVRSEKPFNATAGRDLNGDGSNSDYVPGTSKGQGNRIDMGTFLGNVNTWRATQGRDPVTEADIDSDKYNRLDVRLSKSFDVGPSQRIELIGQLFNVFGTTNLGGVGFRRQQNSRSALFGQILGAQNRQEAEIAVRFVF